MKQLIFSKADFELVKLCVQNELARLENSLFPQSMIILEEADEHLYSRSQKTLKEFNKRIKDCKELLERLKNMEVK